MDLLQNKVSYYRICQTSPKDDAFFVLYILCNKDIDIISFNQVVDWACHGKAGTSYPLCISANYQHLALLQSVLNMFEECNDGFFTPMIQDYSSFLENKSGISIVGPQYDTMDNFRVFIDFFYFSTIFDSNKNSLMQDMHEAYHTLCRYLDNF